MYSLGQLSNGAGPVFFAGRNLAGAYHRALLQFDVAAQIPAGATITGVSLTLYMSGTSDVENVDVFLHRAVNEWGEGASSTGSGSGQGQGGGMGAPAEPGDATWTHRIYPGDEWVSPGGDFEPNASGSASVGFANDFYNWPSTTQLVSDVQGWLDSPGTNFGWLLRGDEISLGRSRRFHSRESSIVENRPVLTVEYEVSGPSADFTGEGNVDGADLEIWELAYGVGNGGDTDDDGDTDGVDFLNWQQQYTGPPELRAVPEPGCAALLAFAVVALVAGWRGQPTAASSPRGVA